jgi:hypothetical protein
VARRGIYDREKPDDELRAMTSTQLEAERIAVERDLGLFRGILERSRGEIQKATADLQHDAARRYLRRVLGEQKWRSP